jgi:leucyl aminopeptidase
MTTPPRIDAAALDLDALGGAEGRVAVLLGPDGALDAAGRRVSELTGGALERFASHESTGRMKPGEVRELAFPSGMAARGVLVLRLDPDAAVSAAREGGAALAKAMGSDDLLLAAESLPRPAEVALGIALRAYDYDELKADDPDEEPGGPGSATIMTAETPDLGEDGRAAAIYLVRDLVNAPANLLTTTSFAERLEGLRSEGLEVEVLEEDRLEALGMRLLLGVGRGSESPTKVVTMRWAGAEGAPLALCGKGVVFDTGGISLKPGAGMEDMTMDMGGAATVAGVMLALARRRAPAHVVGLVGLVENMPDGRAQRPGDVVRSMKGDTVEIINTDAEGRLVLADVMWHAQKDLSPSAVIDLATLTGAIIVALGQERAGVFSNDDALADAFLAAAEAEGEGAWRMPLGKAYDKALKSRVADMKNVGGREAGSIVAAQFLQRFVEEGTPWMHLDIAGVASRKSGTDLSAAGATGWGVLALDRLVRERYES